MFCFLIVDYANKNFKLQAVAQNVWILFRRLIQLENENRLVARFFMNFTFLLKSVYRGKNWKKENWGFNNSID